MVKPSHIKNGKIASGKTVSEIANISKREKDKKFFHDADKFLDARSLFPKSKIDLRIGLTRHQKEKITSAWRELAELAGGPQFLESDFAPAVKTKGMQKYMSDVGIPKFSRGVLLKGGAKLNSKVRVKGGGLHYVAGIRVQSQYPLDATTEKTLVRSLRSFKKIINQKNSFSYIGTHGGKIATAGVSQQLEGANTAELLETIATRVYNKYLQVVLDDARRGGEKTKRGNGRYYAHPDKWGMVLISEPTDEEN